MISSYEPNAPLPKIGSRWVWEIDQPGARALIEVTDVFWNGEEWWVRTRNLFDSLPDSLREDALNDLSRFWEACVPVGNSKGKLTEHRPHDAKAAVDA